MLTLTNVVYCLLCGLFLFICLAVLMGSLLVGLIKVAELYF